MRIKLLHAVLHDGHRVEAGATGILDDDLALTLIDSGAAEEVPDNEPVAMPTDLPDLLAPEADTGVGVPAAPAAPLGAADNAAPTAPATPTAPVGETGDTAEPGQVAASEPAPGPAEAGKTKKEGK